MIIIPWIVDMMPAHHTSHMIDHVLSLSRYLIMLSRVVIGFMGWIRMCGEIFCFHIETRAACKQRFAKIP